MVNQERLVGLFCKFVRIKSPSGQEEDMALAIIKELTKLGITARRDTYGNVIARLEGVEPTLIYCCHMDTVPIGQGNEIVPVIDGKIIRSDGTTILGADNKNFVAAIIEALSVIVDSSIHHRSLEVVFTKDEEQISRGALNLDVSLLKGKECLIADNAVPLGEITLSAPFYEKFDVVVHGKEAHVKNPEKGINAIRAAALLISQILMGRIDDFTTTNVAFVSGGLSGKVEEMGFNELSKQPRNTVPNITKFCGEVRGPKENSVIEALNEIRRVCNLVQEETKAEIEFVSQRLINGYIHDKQDPFVQRIASVFSQQDIQHRFNHSIGGSDANALVNRGIKAVVISSGEENNHTCREQVSINDLVTLAEFLVNFARVV